MNLEIKDNRMILRLSLQDQAAAAAAASAAKAQQALSNIYTGKATGTHITYEKNKVYHLPTAPGSGAITQDNEGAIFGISQKIYHQADVIPPMPETWVRMGGSYDTGQLNTIYVEWISEDRQEYWIQKDNPTSAEDVATQKAIEAIEAATVALSAKTSIESIGSQVSTDRGAVSADREAVALARADVEEKAGIAEQAAGKAETEADRALGYAESLDVNNLTSKQDLFEKSLELFKVSEIDLLPTADFLVRRYVSETSITNYNPGYSQTSTPNGLRVAIPASGSVSIKHWLRLSRLISGINTTISFNVEEILRDGSGMGIGYLDEFGNFQGYYLSASGSFRSVVNFAQTTISSGHLPYDNDSIVYRIKDSVLTVAINGKIEVTRALDEHEFSTELLVVQYGFLNYNFKIEENADPIREFVNKRVSEASSLPNSFYSYTSSGSGEFTVFTKIGGNKYIGFKVTHEVDLRDLIYKDYWRITSADVYVFSGTEMLNTGLKGLIGGESECVWKRNASKDDFTGGIHGDEIVQSVSFYANGVRISADLLSDNIQLTACDEFYYLEHSTMHETAENGAFIPGHPLECYHIKRTVFKDGSYETFNRLEWIRPGLVTLWYHGISCVADDVSQFIYTELDFQEREFTQDGQSYFTSIGTREYHGNHPFNGLSSFVTSRIVKPAEKDETAEFFISDRTGDNKYYRKMAPTNVAEGDIWESVMIVRFAST